MRVTYYLLLLCAGGVPYLYALTLPFLWLDHTEVVQQQLIATSISEVRQKILSADSQASAYMRPLSTALYSAQYALWGPNPLGFHAVSILLHSLLLAILCTLFKELQFSTKQSLLILITWSLLPLTSVVVCLIQNQPTLLSGVLLAGSLLCFIRAQTRPNSAYRYYLLSLAVWILAVLAKELALIQPLVCLALARELLEQRKLSRPTTLYFFVQCMLGVTYFVIHQARYSSIGTNELLLPRIAAMIPVYVEYLYLSVIQFPVTDADVARRIGSYEVLEYGWYLVALLIGLLLQYYLWRQSRLGRLGVLLFNAYLIPVLQLTPLLHFRADRFLYLPSLGIICLIVATLPKIRVSMAFERILTSLGYTALVAVLLLQMRFYQNDQTFFTMVINQQPQAREAHSLLGTHYLQIGEPEKAVAHLQRAVKENREFYSFVHIQHATNNLAVALLRTGNYSEALQILLRIQNSESSPHPDVLLNTGLAAFYAGNHSMAKSQLKRYLERTPTNQIALKYLFDASIQSDDDETAAWALAQRAYSH